MHVLDEFNTSFRMKTEPWAHQLAALSFLYRRDTGALYTKPGTGKTKVMIDLIVNKGFKRVLIVCTNKGCAVWKKQFLIHSSVQQGFIYNLSGASTKEKVTIIKGTLYRTTQEGYNGAIVLVCNYEGIWRKPFSETLIKKFKPDCIICDESHRIKAPGSKCSLFLSRIGKCAKYKYLVSGTPYAERPEDIYAQYRFLDPMIFGTSFDVFKKRYQNLDAMLSARIGFPILDKKKPYKNLNELKQKMMSCAFFAKSTVKLPKRRSIVRHFEQTPKENKLYAELDKEGVLSCKAGVLEVSNILTMSIRKQQLVSGFTTVIDEENQKHTVNTGTSRAEMLKDFLLEFDKEEPMVIFARFRKDLKTIQAVCKEIGRGYSELSGRKDTEADWQAGKTAVLGVQYQLGSESVDFTRAQYCLYYSLTNSLALYDQSKKRIHRPGQTKPVVYYHFVADTGKVKSIDQSIMEALRSKQDVVNYLMQEEQKKTRL